MPDSTSCYARKAISLTNDRNKNWTSAVRSQERVDRPSVQFAIALATSETWFLAPYAPRTGICEEAWFLASARSVVIYFKSAVQELNLPGANYEFAA